MTTQMLIVTFIMGLIPKFGTFKLWGTQHDGLKIKTKKKKNSTVFASESVRYMRRVYPSSIRLIECWLDKVL